jgi:hypothetical protein
MRVRSLPTLLIAVAVLAGCQPQPDSFPAVTDEMTCAEVLEVLSAALSRGQRFIAGQESDAMLASDLVFALSGAEERPECVDDQTRSRAAGMRATINGSS